MEAMRAVVLVTCVISILSGVLDALKPNARFDRQLRLLLSAVFVLGILTPLSQGTAAFQPDWEPDTETAAVELEAAAAQATQKQAAANLEESLEAMLRQHGIARCTGRSGDVYLRGQLHRDRTSHSVLHGSCCRRTAADRLSGKRGEDTCGNSFLNSCGRN